jgi:hypothetical protein
LFYAAPLQILISFIYQTKFHIQLAEKYGRKKRYPRQNDAYLERNILLLVELPGANSQASNTLLTCDYFTDRFSKIGTISRYDLLYSIHVAYSWMPTMLHLFQIAKIADLDPPDTGHQQPARDQDL